MCRAADNGTVHTNPKRKRGSELCPRLRFGLLSSATASSTTPARASPPAEIWPRIEHGSSTVFQFRAVSVILRQRSLRDFSRRFEKGSLTATRRGARVVGWRLLIGKMNCAVSVCSSSISLVPAGGRAGFHMWLLFSAADSGLPVVQRKYELCTRMAWQYHGSGVMRARPESRVSAGLPYHPREHPFLSEYVARGC